LVEVPHLDEILPLLFRREQGPSGP
jgi:hypothetical protein